MTRAARDTAVREFQSEDGPDILFISEVGAQGLNLQRGSIVIFLDHPWSASEAQQVIGRVDRRGQTEDVYSYRLTCPGSVDELVQEYASGKLLMFQVYTGECSIRGVVAGADNGLESEEEDTQPARKIRPQKSAARSKGKAKALPPPKPPRQIATATATTTAPSLSPAKRKRPSRAKQPDPDFPELGVPPRAGSKKRKEYDEKLAELKRARDGSPATTTAQDVSIAGPSTQSDVEMDDGTLSMSEPREESEEPAGVQFEEAPDRSSSSASSDEEQSQTSQEGGSEEIYIELGPEPVSSENVVETSGAYSFPGIPLIPGIPGIPGVPGPGPMRPPKSKSYRRWRFYRDYFSALVRHQGMSSDRVQQAMAARGLPEIPAQYFEEPQSESSADESLERHATSSSNQHSAGKQRNRKRPSGSPEQIQLESESESEPDATSDQSALIGLVADGKLSLDQAQSILRESGQKSIPSSRVPIPSSPRTRNLPDPVVRLPAKFRRSSQGLKGSRAIMSPSRRRSSFPSRPIPQNVPRPADHSSEDSSSSASVPRSAPTSDSDSPSSEGDRPQSASRPADSSSGDSSSSEGDA